MMKKSLTVALAAITTCFAAPMAMADDYPSKPIKFLVGYAAGGSVDIVARSFAQLMAEELGQPVVVENRGGASGTVAAQYIANATPDGYTLYFVASPTLTITPAIQSTSFDPVTDFTPIAEVVNYFNVMMVRADSPYKAVSDVIAEARAKPGTVTYGSAGVGAANHLSGELLSEKAGVEMTHVPFKGNAPAMMSLMGGQISFAFDVNNTALNHISSGKLRALAVTATKRHPSFPDLPTLVEAGYDGAQFTGWFGLIGPAKMPDAVVQKLTAATNKIVQSESFSKQMLASGYALPGEGNGPEQVRKKIVEDGAVFRAIAKRTGLGSQ